MKAKKISILIQRSPMENIAKTVWAHEIPVLEAIHGEGKIKVNPDGQIYQSEDLLNVADESEYSRLARAYGRHKERGISNVEHVFGHEAEGKVIEFYEKLDNNLKKFTQKSTEVKLIKADELSLMDVSLLSAKGIKSKLDEFGIQYGSNEKIEDLARKLENALLELQAPVSSN